MASPLQNRIVGTLIVIALAVIILPDLLSGKNVQREENLQVTPLRPQLDTEFEEADFPSDFDEQSRRDSSPLDIAPIDEPEIAEVEALDDEGYIENGGVRPVNDTPVTVEPTVAEPQPEPQPETQPDEEMTSANAWVIQLGAFRNQQTVTELANNLKAEGFSAYTRRTQGSNGELHLLLVGPDLEREALEEQLSQLKELTSLEGRIVRFQPAQ